MNVINHNNNPKLSINVFDQNTDDNDVLITIDETLYENTSPYLKIYVNDYSLDIKYPYEKTFDCRITNSYIEIDFSRLHLSTISNDSLLITIKSYDIKLLLRNFNNYQSFKLTIL
jgi:hypothetical protein